MASRPALDLVPTAQTTTKGMVIPNATSVSKMHVWKIGDAYYEDISIARVALTDQLLEEFFEKNNLKTPGEISAALAIHMRSLSQKVEEALK